jgi:hypothetical protein
MNAPGLMDIAPTAAPDIYPHILTTMTGRMPRPGVGATVELESRDGLIAALEISISDDTSATTRWASQFLKALDYQIMSSGENSAELEKKIVALSVKYRVLSKYTAWLAVDYSRKTDQVIVQTRPSIPDDDEFDAPRLQVSYCLSSSFDTTAFETDFDPFVAYRPHRRAQRALSPDVLTLMQETFGDSTMKASPSKIRFKRLKRLIALLMSFFNRRKKPQRRR